MILKEFLCLGLIFSMLRCSNLPNSNLNSLEETINTIQLDSIVNFTGLISVRKFNHNPICYLICYLDSNSTSPYFNKYYFNAAQSVFFDENSCNLKIPESNMGFLDSILYGNDMNWDTKSCCNSCWFYFDNKLKRINLAPEESELLFEHDEKFHKKLESLHEYKSNDNMEVFIDSFEKAYVNDRPKPFYISQIRENPKVVEIRLLEFFDDYNRLKTAYYDKNKNHIIYDLNLRPRNTKRLTEKVSWSKIYEYYPDFDKEVEIDPSNSFYNDREWYIIDDHYLFNEVDSLRKYRSLNIVGEKLSQIIESYCK